MHDPEGGALLYRVIARVAGVCVISALLVAGLWVSGCSGCAGKSKGGPLFEVAGQQVTAEDVLESMPASQQIQLYNQLLGRVLIEAEAKKQNITVDETIVDLMVAQMENVSGGAEALDKQLSVQGLTREALREDARRQVLTYTLATQRVEITDEEVREFFDQNSEAFGTPASYKFEVFQDTSKDKVEELVRRVNGGESFLSVADALVPGTTRASEAEIQFMSAPEVAQVDPMGLSVVQGLQPGQMSEVQEMPFSTGETMYRVYMLFDRTEADVPPFEQVEPLARLLAKMSAPNALDPNQLVSTYLLDAQVDVLRDDLALPLFETQLTEYKSRQTTPNEGEIPLPPEAAGAEIPVPPAGELSEAAAEDAPATEDGGAGQ